MVSEFQQTLMNKIVQCNISTAVITWPPYVHTSRSTCDTVSALLISWPMTSGWKGLLLSCAMWKLWHFLRKCCSFHTRCRVFLENMHDVLVTVKKPMLITSHLLQRLAAKDDNFSFELHSNLFFLTTSTTACWLGLSDIPSTKATGLQWKNIGTTDTCWTATQAMYMQGWLPRHTVATGYYGEELKSTSTMDFAEKLRINLLFPDVWSMLYVIWDVRWEQGWVTLSCSTVMCGSICRSECVSREVTQMLRTMVERRIRTRLCSNDEKRTSIQSNLKVPKHITFIVRTITLPIITDCKIFSREGPSVAQ